MTKSTITRERAEQLANFKGAPVTRQEEQELARIALAAMDSEPVIADCDPEVYEKGVSVCLVAIPKETAEVICQNITAATGCKVDWHYFGGRVHIKALRVAPQPAPAVPEALEHLRSIVADPRLLPRRKEWISGQQYSYVLLEEVEAIVDDACRAAILQAEPVTTANKLGNSPVIPDTWIPVSERMPEVGVKVLCFPAEDEPIHAAFNGQLWLQDVSWSGSEEPIDNVIPVTVTHWMPLPAGPQEVR
ncbi:DUF551 domain-containing protein [Klebsiella pneumoniae]|uniref:DUF551 domain-containing protein n=1 Tax=Klebsiella pneumoniae TaxID=573 RepID=UPI001FADD574|nr:DUF551 domain-containing protein [Klebsiella pneumoniae]MCI8181751.1 DUF551 domain-containing protein [Klebsiella pneumoniae]WLE35972.1 DUF551 domain-containing protein [Klebsiella pneumoniae]